MSFPNDPFMLMSVLNTKLRDEYPSLDELCQAEDLDKEEILQKMAQIGMEYIPEVNQFK
ncbi:MAG: DUF4250 domain-containing protein [Bacteroidaceae bacterium]|nr:DUF4250 domain-containing protein [Candidatus Minthousia equi]MCQ2247174.1 DUF4250 domain-containing protein [Bacteroidaceae bacterium]MDO4956620.1 DUF4250 domain-containing protein [Bacteroidales bacterium]